MGINTVQRFFTGYEQLGRKAPVADRTTPGRTRLASALALLQALQCDFEAVALAATGRKGQAAQGAPNPAEGRSTIIRATAGTARGGAVCVVFTSLHGRARASAKKGPPCSRRAAGRSVERGLRMFRHCCEKPQARVDYTG